MRGTRGGDHLNGRLILEELEERVMLNGLAVTGLDVPDENLQALEAGADAGGDAAASFASGLRVEPPAGAPPPEPGAKADWPTEGVFLDASAVGDGQPPSDDRPVPIEAGLRVEPPAGAPPPEPGAKADWPTEGVFLDAGGVGDGQPSSDDGPVPIEAGLRVEPPAGAPPPEPGAKADWPTEGVFLDEGAGAPAATAGNPVTFTDADGDDITVSVIGQGRVDLEFTGPTPNGSDIVAAVVSGGSGTSRFRFVYDGAGNGVQIADLDIDSRFQTVRVEGDVDNLDVSTNIASTIRIDGALSGGEIDNDLRGRLVVDTLDGDLTIGDDIGYYGSVEIGTHAAGVLRVTGRARGEITIAGDADGDILVGENLRGPLTVGGRLTGTVAAGGSIWSLSAGDIDSATITAGFDPDTGVPTGLVGDVRSISLLSSDIVNTTIAATHSILYSSTAGTVQRLGAAGGGTISGVVFSAGFGPGSDGIFGTGDDAVLNAGRIGNIGSPWRRFADIDGTFQASRHIFDINSAGKLGDPGDLVWARRDIDDLRAGGALNATVAAGDSIDSIVAGDIFSPLISAGFARGANNVFDAAGDDVVSGRLGHIDAITVSGSDIVNTVVRATGNIGPTQVDGSIVDAVFSAGFDPVDGILGNGNDAVFWAGDIVGINADGAGGVTGTFRAADDIGYLLSDGILGSAGDMLWAGDDMGAIRSFGNIGFDVIRAGDLSGTGVINRIAAKGLNVPGGPDSTILSDLYASLRINAIISEALTLGGTLLPPTVVLNSNMDTDGDGV